MAKSKYHQSKDTKPIEKNNSRNKKSWTQALSANIKKVLKIKNLFPELSLKKIEKIYKTINKSKKKKPYLNITTKGLSRRQVIIPMGNDNISKFMLSFSKHIANINRVLKDIKSDILADFT